MSPASAPQDPSKRIAELEETVARLDAALERERMRLKATDSQLHEYQDELIRLETQANVSQLVRGLAHELNNPLAVILGNTEHLQRKADDERSRKRLNTIAKEVERCSTLVGRLRSYAQPLREGRCPVDLGAVINDSRQRVLRRARPCPRIEMDDSLHMVKAMGAPRALGKVMEQILDNAGQSKAHLVMISAQLVEDRVAIAISNDGIDPSDEEICEAPKPFYSGRSDGSQGLGLSFASSIVRELGGTITLDRNPKGPGAKIIVTLPQAPRREPDLDEHQNYVVTETVLIVDDEALVGELLSTVVSDIGLQPVQALSLSEALLAIGKEQPGAMVLDVNLGQDRGEDVLREALRLVPALRGHIVLVTGDPGHPQVLELSQRFNCPILGKPFHLKEARKVIEGLIDECG
jgi:two-component system NtrC family sensor kinase